jgi:hypothetical protein
MTIHAFPTRPARWPPPIQDSRAAIERLVATAIGVADQHHDGELLIADLLDRISIEVLFWSRRLDDDEGMRG